MKTWTVREKNTMTKPADEGEPFVADPGLRRSMILRTIDAIQLHTRKGLWGLLVFLAVSAMAFAFADHGLSNCLATELRELLGPAPYVILIDIVLALSTACDLVLIAGRIKEGDKPRRIWFHLSFRTVFYLLYFIADALSARVLTVFLTGVLVLGLEQYALMLFATRTIREGRELLAAIAR